MSDVDLDDLRAELDDFADPEKKGGRSAREERIIAGFDEIQRFVEKNGRAPQHGEDRDIFERLYAVRLDRLRALGECRSLLAPLDHQGLLAGAESAAASVESIDEDELLAELGGRAFPNMDHNAASVATVLGRLQRWYTNTLAQQELLNLDSSLGARKQLAQELGYTGALDGSAEMNVWLHKQVMVKLAEGGGKVPDSLKT